jgi:hypothetical protein
MPRARDAGRALATLAARSRRWPRARDAGRARGQKRARHASFVHSDEGVKVVGVSQIANVDLSVLVVWQRTVDDYIQHAGPEFKCGNVQKIALFLQGDAREVNEHRSARSDLRGSNSYNTRALVTRQAVKWN